MYQARLIDYLRKIAQVAILLLLFSSQLIVLVPTVSCGDVVEVSANDIKQKLNKYCLRRLNFKTIAQFNDFVEIFREFDEITPVPDKLLEEDDKLGHLVQCLYEKESIYALQQLVNNYDRERPCKYTEVTKLEEYAKEHFISNPTAKTMKFFTLFGVTIGINCQINLMAHLKQADAEVEQMDFIYSTAAPTGWNVLIDEYTKKSMKYGTSTNQDSHVINKIARLVPGLSSIDQVDYLNFHHVMNDVEISQHATKESGYHELKNLQLKPKVVASLYKVINSCKNLDKFYVNLVLSMAKLNGLNLLANVLHGLHDHNALLHKWLVATSFCQLMSRVEMITPDPLKKNEKKKKKQFLEQISIPDENSPYIKFDLVHYDLFLEDRRVLYSYAAPFEEIHERAGEFAWQAMVNEGSWRQKREAIWLPGERPAISRAMRSLVQYVKGVEHDFQYELDHQNTQQEKNLDAE